MYQTEVVEKIKRDVLITLFFRGGNLSVYDIMCEKYGADRQATVDKTRIMWGMRCACRIIKARITNTHS